MAAIIKKILFWIGWPLWWILKSGWKISFKWKWGFGIGSIILIGLSGILMWTYLEVIQGLPSPNEIYNPPKLSTIITDRNGNELYRFYENENRSWVKYQEIPDFMVKATIAVEDAEFFEHKGVSIKGLIKALWHNLTSDSTTNLHGGSTITQQLVKNTLLSPEQTIQRKLKEMVLALMVERQLTKEEIMERYLNQVSFGGETYGILEASKRYFGKNPSELNKSQLSMLAGIMAAPTSYSPINNYNFAKLRQKKVLEEMVSLELLALDEANQIYSDKIVIQDNLPRLKSGHFVFFVRDYLMKNFDYSNLTSRGLIIRTTLDGPIQAMAEHAVAEEIAQSKRLGYSNGAAIITKPRTGEILAMVGSKNYWAEDIDGKYNVTTALRQPGSSIKPINYLLALKKGKTLSSIIEDSPVSYKTGDGKVYTPKNYTGKFMGKVTLKTALASSLNIPSVKLLAENGVDNMIDLAESMGITTWEDRSRYGLSLALGGGEVKMVDMATAYGVLANLGEKVDLNPILEIKNYLGETIYQADPEPKKVVDSGLTFLINKALSDNEARTPVFGPNSKLVISGKTVAVKTGTTNSLKDNWCIGWNPNYLAVSWVGNNDNRPMNWVASGVSGATPIWNKIMTTLLKDQNNVNWPIPDSVVSANNCGKNEFYLKSNMGKIDCILSPTPTP